MDSSMSLPVHSSISQHPDLEVESLRAENERLKAELAKKDALIEDMKNSYILAKNVGRDNFDAYMNLQATYDFRLMFAFDFAKTVSECGVPALEKSGKNVVQMLKAMPKPEEAIRPTNEYCEYPLPIDEEVDDNFDPLDKMLKAMSTHP